MNIEPRQSISDRIRELAAAGHSRADIARMVDRSYQQVRQVLVADEARARRNAQGPRTAASASAPSTGVREPAAPAYRAAPEPRPARLQVDGSGRVQLPPEWRVQPGSVFIARNFRGDIVLMDVTRASEAARIESMGRASDDLIAERRLEAMREFDD
ncbi:MAG TPA: hypothetical protein VFF66_09885 [Brevundimonas sp.]|nr:hypothetical protein [Brevundimonas sp.]